MKHLRLWRYWTDFIVFPPLVIGIALWACRSWEWAAMAVLGALAWTFAEYWIHRSVLHRWFWRGAHEHHHDHPDQHVESIWWYAPVLFATLAVVLPLALWTGFAAGYVAYLTVHHGIHHLNLRRHSWLYRHARWHGRHHKFGTCNFGVSVSWWDRVFRTSK